MQARKHAKPMQSLGQIKKPRSSNTGVPKKVKIIKPRRKRASIARLSAAPRKLRNSFEQKLAECMKSNDVDYEYESIKLSYTKPAEKKVYVPDFVIPNTNIVLEAKGVFSLEDRKKMLLVVKDNPHLDIRLVFQRDNLIYRGATMRYSDWCKANHIKYCVSRDGTLPAEWIAEFREKSSSKQEQSRQ